MESQKVKVKLEVYDDIVVGSQGDTLPQTARVNVRGVGNDNTTINTILTSLDYTELVRVDDDGSVTIKGLEGVGDRGIGVDSTGKLKEFEVGGGIEQYVEILNNTSCRNSYKYKS